MERSAREQVTEDLAQLGIKRGSIIWPILALLVAALILAIYFQKSPSSRIDQLFADACAGVETLELASHTPPNGSVKHPLAQACFMGTPPAGSDVSQPGVSRKTASQLTKEFDELAIVQKWDAIFDLYGVKENKIRRANHDASLGETVNHIWQLSVASARIYAQEVIAKFGGIVGDLAESAWLVGLISLIPGIAGMVYRRNFWGWFLPTFLVLFVVSSGIIGRQTPEGSLFIFLVSQLLIILLALRLQRYTRRASSFPAAVHNWIVAIALGAIAVAWFYGVGANFWSWIGSWYQYQLIFIGLPVLYSLLRRSDAWSSTEPKNIVVCLDGTTNTPDQLESGRLAQTNVFKMFKMLKSSRQGTAGRAFNASLSKRYGSKQLGLYYSGVGNKFEYDPIVQTLGGATGLGAAGVVDKAYLDIIRVYRPGDRIFIYGFSRGSAIARLLARAIHQRGAPKTIWTWRLLGRHWTLWQSRLMPGPDTNVPIKVLGCFDTVGAFGIGKNIAGINFQKLDLFKDLTVPDNVEQAYHMVALDETREEFSPTLMDPDPIHPTRIVEVWFAGDHANIGGGWATTKLSDLTMDFLLKKVSSGYAHDAGMTPGDESWGMYLSAANANNIAPEEIETADAYAIRPEPLGQLRLWKSAIYNYKPRVLPHHAVLSETVFERMTQAVPLYAPASLFKLHEELNLKRESINAGVKRLAETQSISSQEHDAILSFKDRLHLIRWPQYQASLKDHGATPPNEVLSNKPGHTAAQQ